MTIVYNDKDSRRVSGDIYYKALANESITLTKYPNKRIKITHSATAGKKRKNKTLSKRKKTLSKRKKKLSKRKKTLSKRKNILSKRKTMAKPTRRN